MLRISPLRLHLVPTSSCMGALNSDLPLPYMQVETLVGVADALGRLLQNDHQVCFWWKTRGIDSAFI